MRKILWFSFLLLSLAVIPALAQDATVVGTVTDKSGAVVPETTITITNVATGESRTLTSNESGQYVAAALHIGTYTVKAEARGFNIAEVTGVVLNVGDRRRIDFNLSVGAVQQSVTVEATAVAIKTDTG